MAGKTTSAVIHQAFKEAFRKAHSEQYGVYPSADTIHQAWEETVVPVLEKAWPQYEDLNVSEMLLFVKAAVYEAMKNATGGSITGRILPLEQAQNESESC